MVVSFKYLLGQEGADSVDVKLDMLENNIIITMRGKGKGSNLGADTELTRLLGESCDIQYSQAIGFNNYTLTFEIA